MERPRDQELLTLGGLGSLVALLGFLALPSRLEAWFDGLPWSQRVEVWVAAAAVPLLLILGRTFLNRRVPSLAIAALLVMKLLAMAGAPASGWELRVYATPQAMQEGRWEPTYATIWRPGLSEVLGGPWSHIREFPIEWINRGPTPPGGLWLGLQVQGFARLPEGAGLALAAGGLETGWLTAVDDQGRETAVPVVADMHQAAALDPRSLPGGMLGVRGEFSFHQGRGPWSLAPVLVRPGGRVEPAFKQGALWRGQAGLIINQGRLHLWQWLARVMDLGLLLWLGYWAAWTAAALWRNRLVDAPLAGLAAVVLAAPHLWTRAFGDPERLLGLGAAATLACAGLALDARLRPAAWRDRAGRLGLVVCAVLGPGVLAWFCLLWGPEAGRMTLYSQGDDWQTYQNLARRIFLDRDWFDAAAGVWYEQPLYRYVVGLLHSLFGQSSMAQNLLDVWSALGAAGLVAAVGACLGLGPAAAMLGALLFLAPEFMGPFRYHLGRGLQEHLGMLYVMLTAWSVLRWRGAGLAGAVLAGSVAVIGFWVRQDHLGVLAGLGTLCAAEVRQAAGPLSIWKEWLGDLWRRRAWLLAFLIILGLGALAVAARNRWFGGLFLLTAPDNMNFLASMGRADRLGNFLVLLTASEAAPSWAALVLVPGAAAGLAALFLRRGPLGSIPLALGVSLLGLLAPYALVKVSAYAPRFSLHLLPLAALCLAMLLGGARRPGPAGQGG